MTRGDAYLEVSGREKFKAKILSYSLPLMLSGILISITTWTDTLMIGHFRQASEVGIYNAALPTAQLIYMIPYVFMVLFLPVLTELYAKGKTEVLEGFFFKKRNN